MTSAVRVRVPAKVNLALRVGATDAEGYHSLGTVFQALSLFDDVTAESAPAGRFSLAFRGEGAAFLPTDDTNLAMRAAKLLAHTHRFDAAGVRLLVRKRIPVAGGMAGGSADAAAVLVACNELWDLGVTPGELRQLGARLGADVPFMLMGGTALGLGRGDQLQPLPAAGAYHWTLALSHAGLSTPTVFKEFDELSVPGSTDVPDQLLHALAAGDVAAVGAALTNDLTGPATRLLPSLGSTLEIGLQAGAVGAVVSGSGPTCAFLSRSEDEAALVEDALSVFSGVRAVRRATGPVPGAQVVD